MYVGKGFFFPSETFKKTFRMVFKEKKVTFPVGSLCSPSQLESIMTHNRVSSVFMHISFFHLAADFSYKSDINKLWEILQQIPSAIRTKSKPLKLMLDIDIIFHLGLELIWKINFTK